MNETHNSDGKPFVITSERLCVRGGYGGICSYSGSEDTCYHPEGPIDFSDNDCGCGRYVCWGSGPCLTEEMER